MLWMKRHFSLTISSRLQQEASFRSPQSLCSVWRQRMHTINAGGSETSNSTCLEDPLRLSEEPVLDSLSVADMAHLLQKCGQQRDRMLALRLHCHMRKNGLDIHRLLGNYLIPTLVDVGKLNDAREIFDRFANPNEWSWNSLINGYIRCGKPQDALQLYQKMRKCAHAHRDGHTFVAALKACAKLKNLEQGELIHEEIAKLGLLHKNIFVANTVIDMYAKCGSLLKAQQVFDRLPKRTVVSWNALITGYAEHGRGNECMDCLEKMHLDGVFPNAVTFLSALRACSSLKAVKKGIEIHREVERQGLLESHPLIGTTLVDLYSKCGLFAKAQQVFNRLPCRDVISWTALITGYADHGHGRQAIKCFEQMQREGIPPNAVTFIGALKACGVVRNAEKGQEIHAKIDDLGLVGSDIQVSTALLDMYSKLGLLRKAQQVFDKLPSRDIISWNTLIAGYAEHGHGERTLECFEQMQDDGVSPDEVTYIFSLKACGSIGAIEKGTEIHEIIRSQGHLGTNQLLGNSLVNMYAKCGLLSNAQQAFDELQQRDVITWTSLMVGYTEHGQDEDAIECFEKMKAEGLPPNEITFISSLKACGNISATEKGAEIHVELERQGLLERNPVVGTSLVDMYAKFGLLAKAQQVFCRIPIPDGVSWTALMAAHAQVGETANVIWVYERMLEKGVKPTMVTFVVMLSVCRQGCLLNKSQTYFETMSKDFGIAPAVEHLTCMVSLLGCAGELERAKALIERLPVCTDNVAWNTVLGVCRHLGSLEFGKLAFNHLSCSTSNLRNM
ncbi:hypothetical protein GOP47_0018201 [Adiantum capillus-veneris]|uniref:Pentatricopeptide repeat-containing protein n=1 Tax=Adiantum capillus-veneris TaxID=13818 RepID=A0A9D4Z9X2_ADICA|nr:hypothetical protein GOP47_0018201 [Adiantum capillus-veneris]